MARLLATLSILVSVALIVAAPLTPEAEARSYGPRLSGTWRIEGTPDASCGPIPPFVNFTSITRDGKVINVDPQVGVSVGEVYRLGGRRYGAGFFGFIEDGSDVLSYEVQGTLRLVNASRFSGNFRTVVSNLAGEPVCTYQGTIDGYRLAPSPF